MVTFCYSVLHFLVDFTCAHAMFRLFTQGAQGYANILVYNFCAFALQMPMGTLLDYYSGRWKRLPAMLAAAGVGMTILGSFLHPALLGLGNAAFHVGGGVDVIREDSGRGWSGKALGIFVAPGALGLFLGGQSFEIVYIIYIVCVLMVLFLLPLFRLAPPEGRSPEARAEQSAILPLLCCFAVVILRSYVGLAVVFSWKTGFGMGLMAVLAVVLGKMAGGLSAAWFGTRRTVLVTLLLAAGCYLAGEHWIFGLLALFFFNMTMPVTLYQLWLRQPELPGFSFGLLTFGLFLGFLPVYCGWPLPLPHTVLGCVGSLCSLALLIPAAWRATTSGSIR